MTTLKLNKQSEIVGKPFCLVPEEALESYVMWSDTERRMKIGRMKDGKFEMYQQPTGWVSATYDPKIWRKQYMRTLILDKNVMFKNVWNPDAKQRGDFEARIVRVPFGKTVEDQIKIKIDEENKRGGNPYRTYFMLNMKKTGSMPTDVEYTLVFEKMVPPTDEEYIKKTVNEIQSSRVSSRGSAPSSSQEAKPLPVPTTTPASFAFTVDAPVSNEDTARQQRLIDEVVSGIKASTISIPKERLASYRNSMIAQANQFLSANKVDLMTAEEVITKYILS